jgi:hypothetical protein
MYIAFTLIQPIVWLFLFGQLFKRVTDLPGFGQGVAGYNPVNWTLTVGRGALMPQPDWGQITAHLGYLAALVVVCGVLATRAFRAYQRSI